LVASLEKRWSKSMLDNMDRAAFSARTTTGQTLSIRYDAAVNAVVMVEQDWFAGSFRSSGVPPKSQFSKRLGGDNLVLFPRRRASAALRAAVPR
jgi:hypothetical protein